MHRLLKRQIERLGLTADSPPDNGQWRQVLERVGASYAQSDEARQMAGHAMDIASREMRELHDRERSHNEQLEQRVRERTAELEQAELGARESALRQRLIAEFGQQALAGPALTVMMDRAAELVTSTLAVEHACVMDYDPATLRLTYRAVVGWPREWVDTRVRDLKPGMRLEQVVSRREPLVVDDYAAPGPFSTSALVPLGVCSGAHVPIFGQSAVIGALSVHSRTLHRFTADEVSFLRSVANILAIAIERKSAEDRLAHLARFDTITGLPNRHLFRDRLEQALTQARRHDWLAGVLFIDLDRFKTVNDTFGHAIGDKLLAHAATRLKQCVRSGDTVARLSGDEFAVALSSLARADDAGIVAQKIVHALAAPFDLEGHEAYVSASIGIALRPGDGDEAELLIKNADTAMYRAKEQGRNCYQFYLPQMNERLVERLRLETRLRGALDRGEFRLHYQPKARLDTGAISGFEALLRWQHGDRLVPPAEFIPILEDTGLIGPVGEWVLRDVCRQIRSWLKRGIAARPVSVNVSARQFQHRNFPALVGQILRETGVAPDLLELELTETVLMSDAEEAVQMLRELKALGVRLSIDDFGTGYSSLAYLRRFPLDTLKIDRAFVRDAISDPDDATLTLTIINLAHSLKVRVVAEGVETPGQLSFLREHGCDEIQGFYFARPLEEADCTRALQEDRRLPNHAPAASTAPGLLLVDDCEDDLKLLALALAADGYRVVTANSPAAGFEALARHGADIVVTDQNMPGMSGIEFLSSVRKLYPTIVRVVATGEDDSVTMGGAINVAGIHKFLSKRWEPDRLRAEVRDAFERR